MAKEPFGNSRGRGYFYALLEELRAAHFEEITTMQAEIRIASNGGIEPRESTASSSAVKSPSAASQADASQNTGAIAAQGDELETSNSLMSIIAGHNATILQKIENMYPRNSEVGAGGPNVGLSAILDGKRENFIDRSSAWAWFRSIVRHSLFEATFCLLIFLNALLMAYESQLYAVDVAVALKYPYFTRTTAEDSPAAFYVLEALAWVFGLVFFLEILAKIVTYRHVFFQDPWNWLDTIVAVVWFISRVGIGLPINSQLFRLARFFRLLRLLRLVRKIEGLDALFIMTTAIKSSMSVLFWTFVLLSMVQLMMALFLNQVLIEFYFQEDSHPLEERIEVFTYFGTFTRSFFSMFELTLANWPPACRILAQNVTEWFFLFGLLYKLSIGFAVVGVINSVFMQETFKVASMDDVLMVRTKDRQSKLHARKMLNFLQEADHMDGDGHISKKEFFEIVSNPQVRTWLSSMELDTRDAADLFDMIDQSKDGRLSFEELVHGVAKLKGSARSVDVAVLIREMRVMLGMMGELQTHFADVRRKLCKDTVQRTMHAV